MVLDHKLWPKSQKRVPIQSFTRVSVMMFSVVMNAKFIRTYVCTGTPLTNRMKKNISYLTFSQRCVLITRVKRSR